MDGEIRDINTPDTDCERADSNFSIRHSSVAPGSGRKARLRAGWIDWGEMHDYESHYLIMHNPEYYSMGKSPIGLTNGQQGYLDGNGNGTWGVGDTSYRFGVTGDTPITGDWHGL